MGISITTYKLRNSFDKQYANMLIAGFNEMLRHCRDDYLTKEDKTSI